MSHYKKSTKLLVCISFLLGSCLFVNCAGAPAEGKSANGTPAKIQVALQQCQALRALDRTTTVAPVGGSQTLYIAARNHLYAVDASTRAGRWCQQLTVTRSSDCPAGAPCPADPGMLFGTPKIVDGVAYVCAFGDANTLYALNAKSGMLIWQKEIDCGLASPAFLYNAQPLVGNGVVYAGTYALRASDGTVLWHLSIDTQKEGALEIQVLDGNTLYANTIDVMYAIDVSTGKLLWHYEETNGMAIGGPLVVANQKLYAGTIGSADNLHASRFYALDAHSGALLWQYAMGDYQGAVVANGNVYVSSRDRYLYAFQEGTSNLLWKHLFPSPTYQMATSIGDTLSLNSDEVYLLSSGDGTVLWHKNLHSKPNILFTPSVIVNGVMYLASRVGSQQSALYALRASDGEIYWQQSYPFQISTFTIA